MKTINIIALICMLMIIPVLAPAAQQSNEKGVFLTASDGRGALTFFWFVSVENWPENGWRLTDDKGKNLVDHVVPMAEETMSGLNKEQADTVNGLTEGIVAAIKAEKEQREQFNAFLAINVFSSFAKAKALGLACQLTGIPAGSRQYKIWGLDKNKKPSGIMLTSKQTDSSAATPLPPAPLKLSVKPDSTGAHLFWLPAPEKKEMPVLSYEIQCTARESKSLRTYQIMKGVSWNPEFPAYIDSEAPVEETLTFQVFSIDVFGRKSLPASVSLFMPDIRTLIPPENLSVKTKQNQITVSWESAQDSSPSGFMVERSSTASGIYESMTPKGLENSVREYTDKTVIPGITYYYRVRSIGSDGTFGQPSVPVKAMTQTPGDLPAPENLTATVNPILVTLNWKKPDYPAAGFIVEKRDKASTNWARLNPDLIKMRTFKDRLAPGTFGSFYYRVSAVGFDDKKSKPCREIEVTLKDISVPKKPIISSISSKNGKVMLFFEPGKNNPNAKTFTILRDLPDRKEGQIVKEGLSIKEKPFVDTDVIPGQGYWYAVVALDENGRQGEWSKKHLVRVVAPDIPKAENPELKLEKKPFTHISIRFKTPPENLLAAIQRQDTADAPWITLNKGLSGTNTTMDTHPAVSETARYRVIYHSDNGEEGQPSDPVGLNK